MIRHLSSMLIFAMLVYLEPAYAKIEQHYSSSLNDYNFNISSNYDRAVLARSEDNFKNAKVWQSIRQSDGSYSTPEMLNLGPSEFKYSDPMLSADGQTLLFISNRPLHKDDVADDYNIWQAKLLNGSWQQVLALPFPINTEADEFAPELHRGVLYFSSSTKGHLSLYQADILDDGFALSEYEPLQKKERSRSDLTFSPDGNIALFWEISEDKKDTHLMMQRKQRGNWLSPIKMPTMVQSPTYEFTPQFSPDGQWLYYSSAKKTKNSDQLNIHKVASSKVFPNEWYQAHLAGKKMNLLSSQKTLNNITSFSYQFDLFMDGKSTTQLIAMHFSPFRICKKEKEHTLWSNGSRGVDLTNGKPLSNEELRSLLNIARYNFIYMFKQDKTQIFKQFASVKEQDRLYRVESEGIASFTLLLNQDNSEILELRYDDQALGIETDYQIIDGIKWPMRFEYKIGNDKVAAGQFSQVRFNQPLFCQE